MPPVHPISRICAHVKPGVIIYSLYFGDHHRPVPIDALLMICKAALQGQGEFIIQAVWIILAAALLLLSLGVYAFLGSRAEIMLVRNRKIPLFGSKLKQ